MREREAFVQREVNTESEYRPYFVVKLQDGTTEDYPIGMVILRSSKDDKDLRDADRESDPDDRDDRDGTPRAVLMTLVCV